MGLCPIPCSRIKILENSIFAFFSKKNKEGFRKGFYLPSQGVGQSPMILFACKIEGHQAIVVSVSYGVLFNEFLREF